MTHLIPQQLFDTGNFLVSKGGNCHHEGVELAQDHTLSAPEVKYGPTVLLLSTSLHHFRGVPLTLPREFLQILL